MSKENFWACFLYVRYELLELRDAKRDEGILLVIEYANFLTMNVFIANSNNKKRCEYGMILIRNMHFIGNVITKK